MREDVYLHTKDGACRSFIFKPENKGSWPGIIFYMDGGAIRPVLFEMAERLAHHGYLVLLPDMFYRAGAYAPFDLADLFAKGSVREVIGPYSNTVNNESSAEDTAAFLDYLDTRTELSGRKIMTVGYCMGGGWSLTAAGRFPDRVAGAASFHGTNLASDSPMSPHLLADYMKGEIYVAGAVDDQGYPPQMADRLEQALSNANVKHRCEFYEGALHAWTMRDVPNYNQAAAERHWRELTALARRVLYPPLGENSSPK